MLQIEGGAFVAKYALILAIVTTNIASATITLDDVVCP